MYVARLPKAVLSNRTHTFPATIVRQPSLLGGDFTTSVPATEDSKMTAQEGDTAPEEPSTDATNAPETEESAEAQAASSDVLYTSILAAWEAGVANGTETQSMAQATKDSHESQMLIGFEITAVDENNSISLRDLDSGESVTVDEAGFGEVAQAAPVSETFSHGGQLRTDIDPETGAITSVITPNGTTIKPSETMDVDITAYGGVAVRDSDAKTTTVYNADGTWRTYSGESTDQANLTSEYRYVQNQSGDYVLRTTEFGANDGVTVNQEDWESPMTGNELVMAEDGGFSFTQEGNNLRRTYLANGTEIDTVMSLDPNGPINHQLLFRTDGSVATVEYDDEGNPERLLINDEEVARIHIPEESMVVDPATGEVTMYNGNGTVQTFKADGTVIEGDPAAEGDAAPAEGDEAAPAEGGAGANPEPVVTTDGPITTTTQLDADGNEVSRTVENSELNITQEFRTENGRTTATVSNTETGEVVSGSVAGDVTSNGDYNISPEEGPMISFDQYGRPVQTRKDGASIHLSYADSHTTNPNMRITQTPSENAGEGAAVEVIAIAEDGTQTVVERGNTIVYTEGGAATMDNWFIQYKNEDGTVVTRDSYNRVTREEAADGMETSIAYGDENEGSTPESITRSYEDGSQLELVPSGDGWMLNTRNADGSSSHTMAEGLQVDPSGEIRYTMNGTDVTESENGDRTFVEGETQTVFARGNGGVVDSVTRTTPTGSDQFGLGEDGIWTRTTTAGEEVVSEGPVENFVSASDGSVTFTSNDGSRQTELLPDGTRSESSTFDNGDLVQATYDAEGNPTAWTATDAESGLTESVTYPAEPGGQPQIVVTDSEGNPVEIDPTTVVWSADSVSYVTPDGQRVEQRIDGTRLDGKPDDADGFARYDNVQWHEVDGSVSSRSYIYDPDSGALVGATGTGTAANDKWTRQPDGTFKRESDGSISMISVEPDGTFKNAYRDENGQVMVDEQRADGAYRTRDSVPTEFTAESGRKMWLEEDGSVYGAIGDGGYYSLTGTDAYIAMNPRPSGDAPQAEHDAWNAKFNAEFQAFSDKGYADNAPFYEHFALDPNAVNAEDVMTFQRTGQTGPVAQQGEDEPSPDEVAWNTRSAESLTEPEAAEAEVAAEVDADAEAEAEQAEAEAEQAAEAA